MSIVAPSEIERAVAALRRGELVAFPTETVYGLGADASSETAVRRIFAAKGRPADHPVIVHLGDRGMLRDWASDIPPAAQKLADRFWPGPLTLILPRAAHVLDAVTGGQPSVGLRMPDHPVALALLRAFGGGIAAPSANRFGRISPTRAEHVQSELGDAVALVLDGGPSRVGVESTIVDLSRDQPTLLRPGHIAASALGEVLGRPLAMPSTVSNTTRAPGTLASHYAPRTPLDIISVERLEETITSLRERGLRPGVLARRDLQATHSDLHEIVLPEDAAGYARELYASLRELDQRGYDRIIVEAVPDGEAWLAVRDRLRRAAHRAAEQPDSD